MDAHVTARAVETERVLSLRIDGQREVTAASLADTERRIGRVESRMWPPVALIARRDGGTAPTAVQARP